MTLVASLARLHRLEAMVAAEKLRRIAVIDARKAYRGAAVDTCGLVADRLGLTRAEAKAVTATALGLRRLPETAALLAAGQLGYGQAQTAVRALADLTADADPSGGPAAGADAAGDAGPDAADGGADAAGDSDAAGGGDAGAGDPAAELDEAGVEALAGGDGRRPWDRARLGRHLDAWAHARGHDHLARRERRAWTRRRLWVGPSRDGDGSIVVEGRLDPLGGGQLLAALDRLSRPDGPHDPRSFAQRRADRAGRPGRPLPAPPRTRPAGRRRGASAGAAAHQPRRATRPPRRRTSPAGRRRPGIGRRRRPDLL